MNEKTKAKKSLLHALYVGGTSFFTSLIAQFIGAGLTFEAVFLSFIAFVLATGSIFCVVMKTYDTSEIELKEDYESKIRKNRRTKHSEGNTKKIIDIIHPWGIR